MIRLFLIIIIAFLVTSCAQQGCPGGMCPPDRYYAPHKKAGKRGMVSTKNNSASYKSSKRAKNSKNDWSRNSGTGKSSSRRSFESDKFAGHGNAGSRFYTPVEEEPFLSRRSKGKSNNFESDKFAGHGNAGSRFYTPVEEEPFLSRRSKGKSNNIESDKHSGHGNAGSRYYSMIEENPFSAKRSKSKNYSHLLGAKKIKNKSRSGHQEGLFSSNVTRYQEKKTYHIRKRGRVIERVGVKKLD